MIAAALSLVLLGGCTATSSTTAGSAQTSSVATTTSAPATTSTSPSPSPPTPSTSSAYPTPAASARSTPTASCLRTVTVGFSVRHRAISACERGTRGGVALVAIGNIHGDETLGWGVIDRLMTAPVPAGVDLWLIRSVNPDGSAQGTRGNAHGVDENRNWPADWQPSPRGSSTYSGPSAFSEPETVALARFLEGLRPRTVVVFHTPLAAVDYSDGADPAVTRYLARASGFPARRLGSRPGAFTAWFNARSWKGTAITFEFARTASAAQVLEVSRAITALARWRASS